jgi:hypothetical protein
VLAKHPLYQLSYTPNNFNPLYESYLLADMLVLVQH